MLLLLQLFSLYTFCISSCQDTIQVKFYKGLENIDNFPSRTMTFRMRIPLPCGMLKYPKCSKKTYKKMSNQTYFKFPQISTFYYEIF